MSHDSIPAWMASRRGPLRALGEILEDMCEDGVISLTRGDDGLTFVAPPNDLAQRFVDALNGDDGEEPERTLQALRSRVVPVYLPDADTWRAKCVRGDGIGTRAGFRLPDPDQPSRRKSSKRLVVGGVAIRPVGGFRCPHRIALWEVVPPKTADEGAEDAEDAAPAAAEWPSAGPPWAPPKAAPPQAETSGRFRAAAVDRVALIQKYGEKWAQNMEETMDEGYLPLYARDPFLIACASLFDYLKSKDPEAYRAVLPLASPIPAVTFVVAVGLKSEVISTRTLAGWARAPRIDEGQARKKYLSHLVFGIQEGGARPARGSDSTSPPLVSSPEGQLELHRARIRVANSAPTRSQTGLARFLVGVYDGVAKSNNLGGSYPVYPQATLNHLGPEKTRGSVLALVDTLRFLISVHVHEALAVPDESPDRIREIFSSVIPTYLDYNLTDTRTIFERTILNFIPQNAVDKKRAFGVVEFFVRTDAFLAFPREDIIGAAVRQEKPPDSVVEPLQHRTFPKPSADRVFSFEWTHAKYLAENYLRGRYRETSPVEGGAPAGSGGTQGSDAASVAILAAEAADGASVTIAPTASVAGGPASVRHFGSEESEGEPDAGAHRRERSSKSSRAPKSSKSSKAPKAHKKTRPRRRSPSPKKLSSAGSDSGSTSGGSDD